MGHTCLEQYVTERLRIFFSPSGSRPRRRCCWPMPPSGRPCSGSPTRSAARTGLGWARLQLVEAGAFGPRAGPYLGRKYGHSPAAGAACWRGSWRCCACWRRGSQRSVGRVSPYYLRPSHQRRSMSTARPSWACSARCRRSTARWTRRCALRRPARSGDRFSARSDPARAPRHDVRPPPGAAAAL